MDCYSYCHMHHTPYLPPRAGGRALGTVQPHRAPRPVGALPCSEDKWPVRTHQTHSVWPMRPAVVIEVRAQSD